MQFLWRKNACWSLSKLCKQTLKREFGDLVLKPGERNSLSCPALTRFTWFRTQESKADDTAEILADRVLEREHTFLIEVISDMISGKIVLG